MASDHQNNQADAYIAKYPRLRKWILQCASYKRQGFRSDLPEQIGIGVASQNIRRLFRPINRDGNDFCDECQVALLNTKQKT
jgi:hypothetical protein